MEFRRRILPLLLLPFVLLVVGTVGYVLIEGWPVIDAFYMAAITMSTVGFGEVRPLSDGGRVFTVVLILLGVGVVAYGFSSLLEYVITADLSATLRRRRMLQDIKKMEDHVIVCGYGRVGRSSVRGLQKMKRPLVIIERDEDVAAAAEEEGLKVIEGDATRDEVLEEAGVDRAWGLIVCTADDSLNLFIVLSARALNSDLFIVTRSVDAENEAKMRRAGANRVVSPYQIGGKHMANIMVRPQVTDFFDVVTLDGGIELWVEELRIEANSALAGKTVGEVDVRRQTGVTLVALLRQGGASAIIPHADTPLAIGDELIVLGTREQLAAMEKLTQGQ